MEARLQRLQRVAPFGDQHRAGVALIHERADLLPEPRRADAPRVAFDEAPRHVDAEAVAAHIEPEGHDVLQHQPGPVRLFGVRGKLPVLGHLAEAVV